MIKFLIHILLTAVRHLRRLERTEQPTPVQVEPPAVVEPVDVEEKEQEEQEPRIVDHRLVGVDFFETANMGGEITPKYLITHYTANGSLAATVKHFQKQASSVSAHLIIDRDGRMAQMVPFNRAAWHAGRSEWGEDKELNELSIGVELVNWGLLETDVDGNRYAWTSERLADEETEKAGGYWWHKYTDEQLEVYFNVARLLVKQYGLENVLGHSEISPRRKVDPGPLFPMNDLLHFCYKDESE